METGQDYVQAYVRGLPAARFFLVRATRLEVRGSAYPQGLPAGRPQTRRSGSMAAMGIRYYAYPVPPELSAHAAADPEVFLGEDPLADAWGLVPLGGGVSAMDAKPRPEMLYLDKSWRLLQLLTCPNGQARSAHQLFEGDVTYDEYWRHRPHTGVLEPSKVRAVAADLSTVDDSTICEVLPDLSAADHAYVVENLHAAKEFVADLAERGWGLVYTIG